MKQLTFAIVFLIPIFLSGCFENSQVAEAKKIVSANLKDPESVTYRNVFPYKQATCGELNAKNGYGAYVGYKKFIVHYDGTDGYLIEGDNIDSWIGKLYYGLSQSDQKEYDKIRTQNIEFIDVLKKSTGHIMTSQELEELNIKNFFDAKWKKLCF